MLDQAIQALGGQAYLDIQDISQEGRTYSFYHGQANSYGIESAILQVSRQGTGGTHQETGRGRHVFNGDQGYEITYKGTRAQDAKDVADYVRRRQYSLDWVLRHWLNENGRRLSTTATPWQPINRPNR